MQTSQSVLHSGTSYINLKVSKKNRRETGAVWIEERREKHEERMGEIWREREGGERKE